MSDRKRLHRGDSVRVGPIRDFSKLYRQPESVNGTHPARPIPSESPHKAARGPLAEGVELAYSVIEKYIAEGRRTAEGFNSQPYSTHATNDNMQEVLERMLRFQAEMLPLWIEMLATLVKVDPSRNGHAPATDAWPRPNGAYKTETTAVSIEVVSLRPVQVSVDLRPNTEAKSLLSLGLNAVDSSKPALTDISFVPDEVPGRLKLRLRIPESQPSGIYSGVIVNRYSGEARGTLSVRIAD